jgi:hypothetical protein
MGSTYKNLQITQHLGKEFLAINQEFSEFYYRKNKKNYIMLNTSKNFLLFILFCILLLIINRQIFSQFFISGRVYYADNGESVTSGKVYILIYNFEIGRSVLIDSTNLDSGGNYLLDTIFPDSVLVCSGWLQEVQNEDHVTTYYPSTIDWQSAKPIFPPDNPVNVNILVQRIIPPDDNLTISGTINTLDSNNNTVPLSNALVVAKQDTVFRNAAVTDSAGNYIIDSLTNGTYTLLGEKIGYAQDSSSVNVGGNSINSNHVKLIMRKVIVRKRHKSNQLVNKFSLKQNYPNPFNPNTKIKFEIPSLPLIKGAGLPAEASAQAGGMYVQLIIYDILGREVTTLVNETLKPGVYEVSWNASKYSSGVYFYELKTDNFRDTKKMLLIK